MGRKSRLSAHSISSPYSRFAELEMEIAESLRPCPRIFPFCGDYQRRLVRSRLPPDELSRFRTLIRFRANAYQFDLFGFQLDVISSPKRPQLTRTLAALKRLVWVKSNAGMGSLYRSQHELVFVFKSGSGRHSKNIELGRYGRNRTNVWHYDGASTQARKATTCSSYTRRQSRSNS
jgi:hypothetical protein